MLALAPFLNIHCVCTEPACLAPILWPNIYVKKQMKQKVKNMATIINNCAKMGEGVSLYVPLSCSYQYKTLFTSPALTRSFVVFCIFCLRTIVFVANICFYAICFVSCSHIFACLLLFLCFLVDFRSSFSLCV